MQFWAEPNPETCQNYGPRIFVKLSPAEQYGTPDETRVYDQLSKLCCWGGADKRYRSKGKDDYTEILGFEFPYIVERSHEKLMVEAAREVAARDRQRFTDAVKLLCGAGAEQFASEKHSEFFAGFD